MVRLAVWHAKVAAAVTLLVTSQPADAVRQRDAGEGSLGHSSNTSSVCTSACGATRFPDPQYAMYTIGVGRKVKYEPKPTHCLSGCMEQAVGKPCGSEYTKVAKATKEGAESETKMCCQTETCTWSPTTEEWHQRRSDEDFLLPLEDMTKATEVGGMSCVCCDRRIVGWGNEVGQFCKRAYEASTGNLIGHYAAAVFTFGKTSKNWKMTCHAYCKKFPTHRFAKKSFFSHSWKDKLCKDSEDKVQFCKRRKAQCQNPATMGSEMRAKCPLTCGLCPSDPRTPQPWRPELWAESESENLKVGGSGGSGGGGEGENDGENEAFFDGVWYTSTGSKVVVDGEYITFADGNSAVVTGMEKGKLTMSMREKEHVAHVVGKRLSWSDGDVWSRSRDAGRELFIALREQPARLQPQMGSEVASEPVNMGAMIAAIETRISDGNGLVRFERDGQDLWIDMKSPDGQSLLHSFGGAQA